MGDLLHHAIDEWAERTPDTDAFRFEDSGLSYRELGQRSGDLAQTLLRLGVQPSDRVGIYMNKSLDLPVAIYGILKAGAVYVPIDPTSPLSRVRSVIEDCGIRVLITGESKAKQACEVAESASLTAIIGPKSPAETDETAWIEWEEIDSGNGVPPEVSITEDDLAYFIYTSGSTGAPKGLMHTHRSGLAYVERSAEVYEVGPECRLGNHSPLHFDMSTFEYLTGPNRGATTVIIPEEVTLFPASLGELIERERLTHWYSVPLALIQLANRGCLEERDGSSLRWVLFGGEPFPPKYLRQLMEQWPNATFSNSYGPAEVNQCTVHNIPPGTVVSDEPIPLGRIWPGSEGLVVNDNGELVEPGEIGELLVRAPTMMQGYWGRPDLSERAMVIRESFRYYRTGDLVAFRPDGLLTFHGRKDRQVKVRGYRVELDEIESACEALESVAEAAAVALRDAEGSAEIIAAVLLQEGSDLDPAALRREIAAGLPAYAVPSSVYVRSDFPRTGSGKIDRQALVEEYKEDGNS